MYTVQWVSDGKVCAETDIPLIMLAVDFVAALTPAQRKTVKVTDNNPQGDVTRHVQELLMRARQDDGKD